MDDRETRPKVEYIPPNFREGISFFGFMIRASYALQAVPVAGVVVLLVLTAGAKLSGIVKLVLAAVLSAPFVFLCITGINGDSLFRFFWNVLRAGREKKTYLYNPRVKKEIRPLAKEPDQTERLPRERIREFLELRKTEREEKADYRQFSFAHMVFEDDEQAPEGRTSGGTKRK